MRQSINGNEHFVKEKLERFEVLIAAKKLGVTHLERPKAKASG
jgi:hypothetical protein